MRIATTSSAAAASPAVPALHPVYGPDEDRNFDDVEKFLTQDLLHPVYGPDEDRNRPRSQHRYQRLRALHPVYGPDEDRNREREEAPMVTVKSCIRSTDRMRIATAGCHAAANARSLLHPVYGPDEDRNTRSATVYPAAHSAASGLRTG